MTAKVFIVDDSAVVRQTVAQLLREAGDLACAGSAPNAVLALPLIHRHAPDVLLIDIEAGGVGALRRLIAEGGVPAVVCSATTPAGSRAALEASAAGAAAVLGKPHVGVKAFLEESRVDILQALRDAAGTRRCARPPVRTAAPIEASAAQGARAQAAAAAAPAAAGAPALAGRGAGSCDRLVLVGSSTGGTQAIETMLGTLPADAPAIAIVQHMPANFTALFAQRLDSHCAMDVREARDGDRLERGLVLIAPGGRHLQLRRAAGQYVAVVDDGAPVNRHRPSVDMLFDSAARCIAGEALAIILTGMGDDGARGMLTLHERGVRTLAQSQASCVVYGMPKEAVRLGGVDEEVPLAHMAQRILAFDGRG